MQTHGSDAPIIQNRFSAAFSRTNSIHHYLWRRPFAYACLALLTCVLCASVARSQTSGGTALVFSPSPGNFGSVAVRSGKTLPVTLSNSSRGLVTISTETVNAAGFSFPAVAFQIQ